MWTRLVAGAAAHDINNSAQGLSNLLSLALSPTASRETLERYAALARDGIKDLRQIAMKLRAVSGSSIVPELQRLDLVALDAVTELGRPEATVDLGPPAPAALVRGTAAALRVAIQGLLRHCIAASAPGGRVALYVTVERAAVSLIVTAPSAPPPRSTDERDLRALLDGVEREFGGDAGLVLAGAAAYLSGGTASAGATAEGGLEFKLTFPRAEEGPQDAR